MSLSMIPLLRRLAVGFVLAWTVCSAQLPEPQNIDRLKTDLRSYHDNGYGAQVSAVAADAIQWLEQRASTAKPGERLTAVFDMDETLVSTWSYIVATDFAYNESTCNAYLKLGPLPAIEPVKNVFLAARKLGIDVVVLTGRRERMRQCSVENLRKIGCEDFAMLICRSENSTGTTLEFKSNERRKLAASGRTIVLTIGDQQSDLEGGYAERAFKLPNPFYYIQ